MFQNNSDMYISYVQLATAETEHCRLEVKVGGMGGGREGRCMYVRKHIETKGNLDVLESGAVHLFSLRRDLSVGPMVH